MDSQIRSRIVLCEKSFFDRMNRIGVATSLRSQDPVYPVILSEEEYLTEVMNHSTKTGPDEESLEAIAASISVVLCLRRSLPQREALPH